MAAPAVELATMYVSIVPSFAGGAKAMESQLGPALKAAGTKAGKDFSSAFSKQEISADQVKKFSTDVEAASAKVAAARQKEEDAAGALRVAESRLAEVRAKGNATASQVVAAEERVATAARKVAAAQTAAKGPAAALETAQKNLERATSEAGKSSDQAATDYAKGWAGLKSRMGNFIKGAVGSGVDDAEAEAKAGGKRAGDSFATAFKAGLAAIGTAAGVGTVVGLFGDAMNAGKSNDRLAAALGLNPAEAQRAGSVAGSLFAGAYGDSMDDVNGAVEAVMSSVRGMRDASNADLEAMTGKVLDLSSAFQIDAGRAAQVAGQLITTGLAKDGVEAADLLAGSLQKVPAAVREDLLDAVDEYGPFMQSLGITGSDAMGMLVSASEKGMYGIDKTGDAIKEFGIRATDMSKTTSGAYDALGLDQEAMTAKLLAGGDSARDAFGQIVHGLQEMDDPVAQSQAALALFGTPLEDLSVSEIPNFLGAIDPMGDAFDTMKGKAGELGTTLADNASTKIESWKRSAQVAFVDILGNKVLPILENVGGFLQTTFGPIVGEIAGGVEAFGTAFGDAGTEITSSGLAGFLEGLGMGLGGIWDILTKGDFTGKLTTAFGWEEDSAVVDFLFKVRDTFNEVVGGVQAFTAAWEANDGEITSSGFPGFMEGLAYQLRQAFDYVRDTVIPAIGDFARFLWDNRGAIVAVTVGIVAYIATVKTLSIISTVKGWIAAAQAAQWGLNAAMSANPIGLVVAGIAALVAGLIWFFTQTDLGKEIVANAWAWIQGAIAGVVSWWQDTLMPIAGQVFGFIGDTIRNLVDWVVANWPLLLSIILGPLGAALAWIIQNWGGISAFFQQVIGAVVGWFTGTLVPGIQAAVAAVGAVFTWLWTNIIQPVFGFISTVVGGFYTLFEYIFKLVVAVITQIVVPAIVGFWQDTIAPVFAAIGQVFTDWWNGAVAIFNTVVGFFTKTIPAAARWLYDNAIKPVFDLIGRAVSFWWNFVVKPVLDTVIGFFTKTIPAAASWLYTYGIKPIFDSIGRAISFWWNFVVKPVLDTAIGFFTKTIPAAASWLYTYGIKPVFDKIGSAIKWVWDKVIKPVFDTLSNAIKKDIPKAFEEGVKFVKKMWEGLQEVVKAPIRFVIKDVINGGLIKGLNNIGGLLGIKPPLPDVALPPGFMHGGYTGDGPKRQVKGPVHAGEYVFTKEQTALLGKDNLAAMASAAVRGGAAVGAPMPGSLPFIQGPLQSAIARTGRLQLVPLGGYPVDDLLTAARAWNGRANVTVGAQSRYSPSTWGANSVSVAYGMMPGNAIGYYSGQHIGMGRGNGLQRETIIHEVGHALGIHHNTGNTSIMHPMLRGGGAVWPTLYDTASLRRLYGAPGSGARPADDPGDKGGGWDPIGDIVNGIVEQFRRLFKDAGFIADIALGLGKKLIDGAISFVTGGGKQLGGEAVRATVFDGGGWLENTGRPQLIDHRARKPDAVLTYEELQMFKDAAKNNQAQQGTLVNFNGPVYGNPQHIVDEMDARKRRAATRANLRSITVGG